MLNMIRMQKEKRRGENLIPKPNCPPQPIFLIFFLINHCIPVKILTEKFSSVTALFELSFDILTIRSLNIVFVDVF